MKYIFLFLLIPSVSWGQTELSPYDENGKLDTIRINGFLCYIMHESRPITTEPRISAAWVTIQHEVQELRERVDSLRRIGGYYHDALYGSDIFGKGLIIEEFNDHIGIIFLERKVDSLIKVLRKEKEPHISDNLFTDPNMIFDSIPERINTNGIEPHPIHIIKHKK